MVLIPSFNSCSTAQKIELKVLCPSRPRCSHPLPPSRLTGCAWEKPWGNLAQGTCYTAFEAEQLLQNVPPQTCPSTHCINKGNSCFTSNSIFLIPFCQTKWKNRHISLTSFKFNISVCILLFTWLLQHHLPTLKYKDFYWKEAAH